MARWTRPAGTNEKDNALVYRVGKTPTSYRLRGLLRSFLLAEGSRRNSEAQRRHHVRASEWFADHHLPALALDHAAEGMDWQGVAHLIDRHGLRLLLSGESAALSRIARLLPDELVSQPATALLVALAELQDGTLAAARRYIDQVGRHPAVHLDLKLRLLHTTALLCEARLRGDRTSQVSGLIELSDEAAPGEPDLELLAAVNRGILRLWLRDYDHANADLEAALRLARRDARDALALECLSYLAVSATVLGDCAAMELRSAEAIEFATRRGWAATARIAPAYLVAAGAAWQRLEDDVASRYLSLIAAIDADLEPEVELSARLLGACLAFEGSANRREAVRHLRQVWPHDGVQLLPVSVSFFCLTELRMALSLGDRFGAAETLARAERLLGDAGDVLVMRALAHAHYGRKAAALDSLAPVLSGAAACHIANSDIASWLLSAHFAVEMDEPARAHEALLQALDLAAPRRMLRELAAASAQVRSMLRHNEGRFGDHDGFVTKVFAAASARGADGLAAGLRRFADEPRARPASGSAVHAVPGRDRSRARDQCEHRQDASEGDLSEVQRGQPEASGRPSPRVGPALVTRTEGGGHGHE